MSKQSSIIQVTNFEVILRSILASSLLIEILTSLAYNGWPWLLQILVSKTQQSLPHNHFSRGKFIHQYSTNLLADWKLLFSVERSLLTRHQTYPGVLLEGTKFFSCCVQTNLEKRPRTLNVFQENKHSKSIVNATALLCSDSPHTIYILIRTATNWYFQGVKMI